MSYTLELTLTARRVPTTPNPQPSTASAASAVAAVAAPLNVTTALTLPNTCSLEPYLTEAFAAQVLAQLAKNAGFESSKNKLEGRIKDLILKSGKPIAIYEHREPIQLKDVFKFADKSPVMHCCNVSDSSKEGYVIFVTSPLYGYYLCSKANSEDILSHVMHPNARIGMGIVQKESDWQSWQNTFAGTTKRALYYPMAVAASTVKK